MNNSRSQKIKTIKQGDHIMKYVINIVKTGDSQQVTDRKKVAEFKTEIEAIIKVSEQEQKLRKADVKNAHVEMLQIMEKDDNEIKGCR